MKFEPNFALGGLATAQKGITTKEGKKMANKKFQLDREKADSDGDGMLSKYEETKGEAIQKAMADDPDQDEKYGMNCGGMMEPDMPIDPVSGNPIPPGSSAENVRDDISINISEGEYVLPADVVKWVGLKHIMDMQDEAKMGLMMMTDMGLIVEADMSGEVTECPMCQGRGCEDCEEMQMDNEEEGKEASETKMEETPEGNEVEYPSVDTVVEEFIDGDTSDDYDEEEMYATKSMPSMFGMVKKPKISFII